MEIHQGGRRLVLLRRPLAPDARRDRGGLHAAHDRARPRRGAHPQPADGRTGPLRLARMARAHPPEAELLRPLPAGSLTVEQVR
jgi:hypothetical protein